MRLTVADTKGPVSKIVNLCDTDSRVLSYINEATERLLWKGHNAHTYGRFRVSTTTSTITWPKELESIDKLDIENIPVQVRNGWYEFLEHGPGLVDDTRPQDYSAIDYGVSCVSTDVPSANPCKIRIYTAIGEGSKLIRIQGKGSDGIGIRTEYPASSGTYVNGENLVTAAYPSPGYIESVNLFTSLDAAQKPETKLAITVKAYDPVALTETTLAVWEAGIKNPEFRRSYVPGLVNDGASKTLVVVGKLRFLPVTVDEDWVIPANLSAVKLMVKAIWLEENDRIQESELYEQKAKRALEEQTSEYLGSAKNPIAFSYGETYGASGIPTVQ